ncbi:MAG: hypothetical protein AB4372_06285 [Xenococcus sp. (in: cyanobacteria)]
MNILLSISNIEKNLWYYGKAVKHLVGIAGNTNSQKPKKSMTFKGSGTLVAEL